MTPAPTAPAARAWSVGDAIDELCDEPLDGADGYFFRRRIDRSLRNSVLRRVFFDSDPGWWSAFIIMLLLSGGVATFGLSQNSAATVIGSMVIAPLGAPIAGLGGAIALAWPRESMRMLGVVAIGAACVVGAAALLALALPNTTPDAQILARTSPDLRDLGVAVLAGAAGGYCQTRANLSSSLVGVAIAVALVPPLATVGLMLEERHWALARGAAVLFAANFVGITVGVVVVLLVTGFVPRPRLRAAGVGVVAGLVATAAAVVAVSVPLAIVYRRELTSAQSRTDVMRQIAATIGATNVDVHVRSVSIDGDHVTVRLTGAANAPTAAEFESALTDELGPNVSVAIEAG